jgi:hypothetical protein
MKKGWHIHSYSGCEHNACLKCGPCKKCDPYNIKAVRMVVGMVARVDLPCGCHAEVAQGAALTMGGTKHLSVHACAEWKKHKWKLAEAERDLAKRLRKFRKERETAI